MLPVGSEPGQYQLRLLDGAKRSRLAIEASGELKDLAVRVNVNRKRQANTIRTGSGGVELSQSFVAELIPNMPEEVVASGFGLQEFPIPVCRKLEVAINFAAPETQIEDVLAVIIGRRGEQF
jgi:hypothetical protein